MLCVDPSFYSPVVIGNPPEESSLKNLQILRVRTEIIVARDQWGLGTCDSLPWVSGLLKALSSTGGKCIEEVIIQVNYKFMDDTCPDLLLWKEIISQICNRSHFARLARAHIMIASESTVSDHREAVGRQITRYVRMHNAHRLLDISTSVSNICQSLSSACPRK